jgi:hypothetical protein
MAVAPLMMMRFSMAFIVGMAAVPMWGCGQHSPAGSGGLGDSTELTHSASDSGAGDDADGSTPVGLCGMHDSSGRELYVSSSGPEEGGPVYAGPAVVRTSTSAELSLVFELAAGADAGAPTLRSVTLSGLDPMPSFPIGAKVWLSKDPVGNPHYSPLYGGPGSALSIRDREGGRLLLGASFNSNGPAAPIAAGQRTDVCSDDNPTCPGKGSRMFYQSVEVLGDSTVTIGDSQTVSVQLDGLDYDVHVTARRVTGGCDIPDYFPELAGGVSVNVRAKDLSRLLDGLEGVDAGP